MFGYVVPDQQRLDEAGKKRFRELYCGLCHEMYARHGLRGTATLSNDLTFLAVLYDSLYEPEEKRGANRCTAHPFQKQEWCCCDRFGYVADMNLALAYHKCLDNWMDDRSLPSKAEAGILKAEYRKVRAAYPDKCRAIEDWLDEIHEIEKSGRMEIDPPANSTGRMLGALFAADGDHWAPTLARVGDGLGRFIYMMDAYDDLAEDIKKKRYNPLKAMANDPNFETFISDGLTMAAADAAMAFEELPLLRDADLLRNVLYGGIWGRYNQIRKTKE